MSRGKAHALASGWLMSAVAGNTFFAFMTGSWWDTFLGGLAVVANTGVLGVVLSDWRRNKRLRGVIGD